MRSKLLVVVATTAAVLGVGVAVAGHVPEVDPASVPTGFLAAHNSFERLPVRPIARAVTPDGADVFVQHVRLDANAATGWHTHPGPALVAVVKGSLTYEDAAAGACRQAVYQAGEGFVDRGFGHVHRAIAGPDGVDFYVTYILPRGSASHVIAATAPLECTS
jgi:quercetin dioxygenase-like cupin family protein